MFKMATKKEETIKKTMTMTTSINIKSFRHKYHHYSSAFLFIVIYMLFLSNSFMQSKQQEVAALSAGQQQAYNSSSTHLKSNLNYLLFTSNSEASPSSPSSSNKQQDSKIKELLRDHKHNHMSDSVNIGLANSIWFKLRKNVQEYARQRTLEARPVINKLLEDANVTLSCKISLNNVLNRIDQLDSWAMESKYIIFGLRQNNMK